MMQLPLAREIEAMWARQSVTAEQQSVTSDWRQALPVISASAVTLRELRVSDAPSLLECLTTAEVARFISPPPTTVEGFERFILWTHEQQRAGKYFAFAIVPDGCSHAVGIIQVRALEPTFGVAEWGFAISQMYWGTGVFSKSAETVIEFAFDHVGVHRLEARACTENRRGNGVLQKLGAVKEGLLRRSFIRGGQQLDQILWSICREDWSRRKAVWGVKIN